MIARRTCGLALGALVLGAAFRPHPTAHRASAAAPVRVIFDSDIGPDVDDAGAVAVLHALASLGEARILAMGCCTSSEWGAPSLSSLNTYFGRPDIPVGTFKGAGFLPESKYNGEVARRFPGRLRRGGDAPDAAGLYRRILAGQPDGSVVFCAVGPLNNLRLLLDSPPDGFSRRTGLDLVRRKVRMLSVMGGRYPEGKEWNFEQDPAAAQRVVRDWPSPILFSGYEIGARILTGKRLHTESAADSPLRVAYELYIGKEKDRESWDQTGVLAAVRGPGTLWHSSGRGQCAVDPATGANRWQPAPRGLHRYLIEREPPERVRRVIDDLMLHQPAARPGKAPS